MKHLILSVTVFLLFIGRFTKAEEAFSPHTFGHIVGGLGSFFLGPLPGLGLSILPEAISVLSANNEVSDSSRKKVFYVNEYSNEYEIIPFRNDSDSDMMTKYENTVKLTNSLKYY